MAHIWQSLRSGDWLTVSRARAYCLILLVICVLAAVIWIALSKGLVDRTGKPIGTDFSSFYAAGSLVLEGKAAAVYDMAAHYAQQKQLFGANTPYYGFLYPPVFLLVTAPLALLPYPVALALWQGGTLALYLFVIAMILRQARQESSTIAEIWWLPAAAFPAVFLNLGHGQNGFLTAALLGAALVVLPRKPVAAGVLIGLLAYKPQFALVIPFALLAAGQWRTILAASVTVAAIVIASYLLFGPESWWSFLASTKTSRELLLESGSVGFEKLQSAFAAVRMWGGSVTLSYAIQGLVSLATICGTAWIWHSAQNDNLKAAALVTATALASPHILDYDLMLLGPAIAFFIAGTHNRLRDYDISALFAIWVTPLFARAGAMTLAIPIGFIAMLALYVLILRHVLHARSSAGTHKLNVAQT